ncbi:DUF5708 family protein [Streptomyces turgidiscabies]|uniref:Uncharacterized protein n=1 Tax=Streptomyces turgidiscabies (strain Car8) TaxID=698760 RepID=L7EWZ2_STRT8|nr:MULTISPECIES: DUF5708 family protein [Streptomyces]ELP62910.1 hypothetical protein STRTUCAR8_07526 [Streptomyces turgidiscabies Car8]MDX3495612.1 DUF5708 family protein [Streptomyces turgidiscabies]GAQ70302.1 hypothetical protein T45_02037 [Streptomyces turgidiscabies]
MSGATKNLLEGAATLVIGLVLWQFAGGVDIPFVTLTKVGVVLMCVGGALLLTGLFQRARPPRGKP